MKTQMGQILDNMIKQLEQKIVSNTTIISEWQSKSGKHTEYGVLSQDENSESTMYLKDTWRAGYDTVRWFFADVKIPIPDNKNHILMFKTDFGGESIFRINGNIVGSVTSHIHSVTPHREEILINKSLYGTTAHIEIESGVCCMDFCDEAMAGAKFHEYLMNYAEIIEVDLKIQSYYFDIKTAYDSLEFIQDNILKEKLYNAIDNSIHLVDFDFDDDIFCKSIEKAQKAFNQSLSDIKYKAQEQIIMAGHSHIDVAWLWTTKETVRKVGRTFANALAMMDRYPDYKYTQSQAILYYYAKKYYPELFERIKQKVKSGQWEITGNTWVEADTNIASGESLIRQLLLGREFFLKEFGVSSDIFWLPDCFGYTWALPQIIKRSGMKYFYTAKLLYNATNKFPVSQFRWKAHSGDEVLAYAQQSHYGGEYNPAYLAMSRERTGQTDITSTALGCYGYGDGGGGSSCDMIERSYRLKNMPGLPETRMGFASDYFAVEEKFKDELPVWDGEMYFENHRGTYTSQAFVKKNNRKGEFLLRDCELLSVMAQKLIGQKYDGENIDKAWRLLLVNQFHDILPGTSIHEVFENCKAEYSQMNKIGCSITEECITNINRKISADKNCIIVWNMLSHYADGKVKAEIPFDRCCVKDKNGAILKSSVTKQNNKNYLEFYAKDVSPMGYSSFEIACEEGTKTKNVKASKRLLENDYIKVAFDNNGNITSIYDKKNSRETLSGKANLLTIFQDKPIHESAWNLELNYQKKSWDLTKAQSIEVAYQNEVKAAIKIVRKFNKSVITQFIELAADADKIDFITEFDWHETEKVLKAAFPVAVRSSHATYEIAHGAIERPNHWNTPFDMVKFEACAHKWADLSESDYGVSILNDCKYGYDIKGNLMRITLMRAPICPDVTADTGKSSCIYSYYPHKNSWGMGGTVKRAFELNDGLRGYYKPALPGCLPNNNSFIEIADENIIIDAVKPAQDSDGIIIRMYEAEAKHTDVKVNISFKFSHVFECNMMEVNEREIKFENSSFDFSITPHQVKTFRIK